MPRRSSVVALALAGVLGAAQLGAVGAAAVRLAGDAGDLATALADRASAAAFDPSAEIAGFADRTTMTTRGRALFYASHPSIEPTSGFNALCGFGASNEIVLGCYDGSTIYISDVTDARLDGIREVTAAHEMLHAAWQRESPEERARLTALLEEAYAALPEDGDIAQRLDLYDSEGLGERVNELHSILGTEIAALDPELEEHYAQFFGDRAAIVALNTSYEAVFTELDTRIDALVAEIGTLATSIEERRVAVNSGYDELNGDIAEFNTRADAGDFASQAAFDSERAALISRGDELDRQADGVRADIVHYDELRAELEGLNADASALNDSLDSSIGGTGGLG